MSYWDRWITNFGFPVERVPKSISCRYQRVTLLWYLNTDWVQKCKQGLKKHKPHSHFLYTNTTGLYFSKQCIYQCRSYMYLDACARVAICFIQKWVSPLKRAETQLSIKVFPSEKRRNTTFKKLITSEKSRSTIIKRNSHLWKEQKNNFPPRPPPSPKKIPPLTRADLWREQKHNFPKKVHLWKETRLPSLPPPLPQFHLWKEQKHNLPSRVTTWEPIFKSLVWLDLEKSPSKLDSNPGSSALKVDTLTTRPKRQ